MGMHRQILAVIAAFILFSNFSCPGECEEIFFGNNTGGELTVELTNPAEIYQVGDEFTLRADFSAIRPAPQGQRYTISENGGLIVTELYRIQDDTTVLEPAITAFEMSALIGTVIAPPVTDTLQAAIRMRYRCPEGNCSFAQSFRILEPGNYVLRITGGPIDEVSAPFNFCQTPNLSNTALLNGNNASLTETGRFLETPYRFGPQSSYVNAFILTEGAASVHFFTVE